MVFIMNNFKIDPWKKKTKPLELRRWSEILSLKGCIHGLETDGRCHILWCPYRCDIKVAPKTPTTIGKMLCPRH